MILPEAFNKNESLRAELVKARPIMDIAFHAADNAEAIEMRLDDSNALANAQALAGQVAINRYKKRIRDMTGAPLEESSPLLDSHLGIDAFDQIAITAEKEAAEKEALQTKPKKKK